MCSEMILLHVALCFSPASQHSEKEMETMVSTVATELSLIPDGQGQEPVDDDTPFDSDPQRLLQEGEWMLAGGTMVNELRLTTFGTQFSGMLHNMPWPMRKGPLLHLFRKNANLLGCSESSKPVLEIFCMVCYCIQCWLFHQDRSYRCQVFEHHLFLWPLSSVSCRSDEAAAKDGQYCR